MNQHKDTKIGELYGKWTIIEPYIKINQRVYCKCQCLCGLIKNVMRSRLTSNKSTQCTTCHNQYVASKYLFKDLTGQKFGEWKVIKRVENTKNGKTSKYLCKCGICGKHKKVKRDSLTSGRSTKCRRCNAYEGLTGTFWCPIKYNAKKREIEFDITNEFAWNLFVKQNKRCSLTNREIFLERNHKNGASLDRIDSTKGYSEDNVQWVHKDVNFMKQDFDEKYFVEICKLIAKRK